MTLPLDPSRYGSPSADAIERGLVSQSPTARIAALEAALSEALDEWEEALNFVHGAAYHASQVRLDALRLVLPGKVAL